MDVERQFERFVDSIGNTDAPREEHRRQLRKQVLAMVESAGASAPMISGLNTRRFIMSNAMFRWSAAAAALSGRRRVHKLLAASVAGLAACLALAIATWILTHGGKPAETPSVASTGGAPRETLPEGTAEVETEGTAKVETPPLLAATPERVSRTPNPESSRRASVLPLPQWMAVTKPSAIVRGKMLTLKDGQLDIEVTRVIYGPVNGKVVHVRARDTEEDARNWLRQLAQESKKDVREPSAEEVRAELVRRMNFAVGREVIVFLKEWHQGGNTTVWSYTRMAVDTSPSPKHFLDNEEKEIVEVIKTGAHLRPVDTTPDSSGRQLAMSEKVNVESERVNLMPVQESSAIEGAEWVGATGTPAIVRGKMLALKDGQLDIEVARVIYGRVDGKVVHVRAQVPPEKEARDRLRRLAQESKKEFHEPSAEEVHAELVRRNNFAVGRDVIIYLAGGPKVWWCNAMAFDTSPSRKDSLDKDEKEVVEGIRTGEHLRPLVAPERYLERSKRVVRARVVKVGETSAQWQVSGLLYVAPPPGQRPGSTPAGNRPAKVVQPEKPATISVELATWRARAETIVRYRVAQQPGAVVKEEDIQVEFTRLLKDELTPGREAILFIGPRGKPEDGSVYKLIGILYAAAGKPNSLDQQDKAIREVIAKIAKGDYNTGIDDL